MIKLAFIVSMLSSIALADDAPVTDEPTAADVAGAPTAGAESGRADELDESDGAGRWVARSLLFIPRVAVTVAFAPIEGTAWAVERYQLVDRAQRLFFNDAGTFGVFPTFQHDSGFGINVGLRLVHRDLFGEREHFDIATQGGGRFQERVATRLSSGGRLGKRVSVELAAEYEKRPKDPFYGIGNAGGTETRFRHRIMRARGTVDTHVASAFHILGAGSVTDHTFGRSDEGAPIDEVFMTDSLAGYDGVRNTYGELELRWDSRGRANDYEPISVISSGTLLAVFAGRVTPLDNGGEDFWRYGMDAQQFFRVGAGPRVIALRSHAEAVSGDRDAMPFNELPRLGGKDVLRGYPSDRFRDKVAMVSSVDYQFDLMPNISASLFVDAGRVQSSLDNLEASDLRVGYGLQLDLHTSRSFLARASLASSIDGGVFFNFGLDPVFELDGRVERR